MKVSVPSANFQTASPPPLLATGRGSSRVNVPEFCGAFRVPSRRVRTCVYGILDHLVRANNNAPTLVNSHRTQVALSSDLLLAVDVGLNGRPFKIGERDGLRQCRRELQ